RAPAAKRRAEVRYRLGFRMPAQRERSTRAKGPAFIGAELPVAQAPRNGKCCPHTCRSQHPSGPAQLGGQRSFAWTHGGGKARRSTKSLRDSSLRERLISGRGNSDRDRR